MLCRLKFTWMESFGGVAPESAETINGISFGAAVSRGVSTTQTSAQKAGIKISFIARLLIMKQGTHRYPVLVGSFADVTSTLRDTMRPWETMWSIYLLL